MKQFQFKNNNKNKFKTKAENHSVTFNRKKSKQTKFTSPKHQSQQKIIYS